MTARKPYRTVTEPGGIYLYDRTTDERLGWALRQIGPAWEAFVPNHRLGIFSYRDDAVTAIVIYYRQRGRWAP